MSLFNIFNVSGSAMSAQAQRLNVVASNLANADSATSASGEAYRARQVVFEATTPTNGGTSTGVRVKQVVEDQSPMKMMYDHAERERGRRDGQHAVVLALVPDQRPDHERGQDAAAQNPDHRPVIHKRQP